MFATAAQAKLFIQLIPWTTSSHCHMLRQTVTYFAV